MHKMNLRPPQPSSRISHGVWERQAGFTAIELMVVISIIAVLAALAGPSFTGLIERWRVRQVAEDVTSTLYYARAESIRRGGNVVIRKTPDNTDGCTSAPTNADWGCGWMVFADTNGNQSLDAGEETLKVFALAPKMAVTITGNGGAIRVDRWGSMTGLDDTNGFQLYPQGKTSAAPSAAALCVAAGGRIRRIQGGAAC